MACAGARLVPRCGKKNSGGIICPPHKLVVATAGKHCHRRQKRQPKGRQEFPAIAPSGGGSSSSGGASQRTTTTAAETSLRNVPLARHGVQAPAPERKSTTDRDYLNKTYSTTCTKKTEAESREIREIPTLPSLPATSGDASFSSGVSTTNEGPQKRGNNRSPIGDGHNRDGGGGDYALRKHGRGNQEHRNDRAGGSSIGSGDCRLAKIWCCPTTESLREEAFADLSGMSRSRSQLWRNQMGPSKEWEDAHFNLQNMKRMFKADQKVGSRRRLLVSFFFTNRQTPGPRALRGLSLHPRRRHDLFLHWCSSS